MVVFAADDYINNKKLDMMLAQNISDSLIICSNNFESWKARVNTYTLIINSLFDANIRLNETHYFETTYYRDGENGGDSLAEQKKTIIDFRKNLVKNINNQQDVMRELSEKILS